jgi:ribonuclease HI
LVPRQKKVTEAGVYCHRTRRKPSFSFGQYTTVLQAEFYAIKACAVENLDRDYKNKNIYILSDTQALGQHQITSKLVWGCHQSLIQLARLNRVQLLWVPCHEDIAGSETADLLARIGSEHPFTGPEPARGISNGVAKRAARDWMNRSHKKAMGIHNWTQTGKGTYIRTFCQKNKGSVEIKQRPIKMDSWTIHRTMSSKGTPFQTGIDG